MPVRSFQSLDNGQKPLPFFNFQAEFSCYIYKTCHSAQKTINGPSCVNHCSAFPSWVIKACVHCFPLLSSSVNSDNGFCFCIFIFPHPNNLRVYWREDILHVPALDQLAQMKTMHPLKGHESRLMKGGSCFSCLYGNVHIASYQ